MKEAGFSSTQVKSNVGKSISLELCSQSSSPSASNKSKENSLVTIAKQTETKNSKSTASESIRNADVKVVIETLLMNRKRKSLVFVGECISNLETKVKALMDSVDNGGVPEALREVKVISTPPLYSFCNLHREEIELKIRELTYLVKSFVVEEGVILYLGDLKWISDYRVSLEHERSYYCSVEHMIMEIGRLVSGIGEDERFWLMGIATFQTYLRFRNGYNSLETVWGLHPITIPANSLGFSLVSESDIGKNKVRQGRTENGRPSPMLLTDGEVKPSCCSECSAKFEAEALKLQASIGKSNEQTLSSLPSWLRDESRRLNEDNDQNYDTIRELCKKWNSFCGSAHKRRTPTFSSDPVYKQENIQLRSTFSSNPNSTPSSASSRQYMDMDYTLNFSEFNAENLNILCNSLEEKVPLQREIIPEIAGTILQCRSGMLRRKYNTSDVKEETWLFFLGPDEAHAKDKISRELAKIVFGSYSNFVVIGLRSFISPTRADSSDDCRNKRDRDERKSYIEGFAQELSDNPHRVFLVEDFEQADHCSQMCIKGAIERGNISNENGEEVGLSDAIIILSCERFSSRSRASSQKQKPEKVFAGGGEEEAGHCGLLDLNISFADDSVEDQSVDDFGIVENVDGLVIFKIHDL